jgi:aliphatic nitrilase
MSVGSKLRLTAIQAAPVFLDGEASLAKAIGLIEEAGAAGSDVIGFPEGFIPAHPLWYHFHPASAPRATEFSKRLALEAIEIPSSATDRLCEAARAAGAFVVMGLCERAPGRSGTLYNTLLFIDRDGTIVGRHRKVMPTLGERLVHAPGDARGLHPYDHGAARVGGLMCGENSNPLATFALDAQGMNVHVASWPSHFNLGVDMVSIIHMVTRALAYQTKSYVINAVGELDDQMREELPATDEDRAFLAQQGGGASIMGPWGQVIAGPAEPGETMVHADVDLADLVAPKTLQDFGGHYNRFDLFHLELSPGGHDPLTRSSAAPLGEGAHPGLEDRGSAAPVLDAGRWPRLELGEGERWSAD